MLQAKLASFSPTEVKRTSAKITISEAVVHVVWGSPQWGGYKADIAGGCLCRPPVYKTALVTFFGAMYQYDVMGLANE